jgi:hypothetical protein
VDITTTRKHSWDSRLLWSAFLAKLWINREQNSDGVSFDDLLGGLIETPFSRIHISLLLFNWPDCYGFLAILSARSR